MRRIVFVFTLALMQHTLAAGFDCKKASTRVEKLICSNKVLSELDNKLTRQYLKSLELGVGLNMLKKAQRQWLKFQRNTCKDVNCLGREYQEKLSEYVSFVPTQKRKPASSAFGQFKKKSTIRVFVSQEVGDAKEAVTQSGSILKIAKKPKMAVLDVHLTFDNAHNCSIVDKTLYWVDNHWQFDQYGDFDPNACNLKLYPANGKLYLADPNHLCKSEYCGMRGAFDGIELTRGK